MSAVLVVKTNPFIDHYEILGDLGEGANGFVKACRNLKTGVKYALKVI
jgi:serine/threonine protein kinase